MNCTTILPLIEISWIIILILESGFLESIENFISKRITKPFEFHFSKPFNCSLCLTFWTLLVYSILVDNCLSIERILIILMIAYLTDMFTNILHLILDVIDKLIFKLRDILNL